jgi:Escherichia/Staphylococcus phage prohead protease
VDELQRAVRQHLARPAQAESAIRRVAFVPELRATNEAKRHITFVSSTEDQDRYGDVIRVNGWDTKQYKRNPIFLWAHRSGDPPIGKCVELHTESQPVPALVQTIEFADAKTYPFADTIYNLYRNKFLRSVSVGFRPLEQPQHINDANGEWTGGYEFTRQELLELSAVPLPANPQAVARAIDAGVVTRDLAARVFVGGEDDDTRIDPDAVALARETLASYAARFRKPPVQCDDEEAVLRARFIASLASVERAVGQLPYLLPFQPLETVDAVQHFLAEYFGVVDAFHRAALDVEAEDFLQQLETPDETLDTWLESLAE